MYVVSGLLQDNVISLLLHLLLKLKSNQLFHGRVKGKNALLCCVFAVCAFFCNEKRNEKEPTDVCIVSLDFLLCCFPQ